MRDLPLPIECRAGPPCLFLIIISPTDSQTSAGVKLSPSYFEILHGAGAAVLEHHLCGVLYTLASHHQKSWEKMKIYWFVQKIKSKSIGIGILG